MPVDPTQMTQDRGKERRRRGPTLRKGERSDTSHPDIAAEELEEEAELVQLEEVDELVELEELQPQNHLSKGTKPACSPHYSTTDFRGP